MAIAVGTLLYVGGTVWAGFSEVGDVLVGFAWWIYIPVLLLTLVNYGLRFWKWHYLCGRVGAHVPFMDNLVIYIAGLAMVISPGKVGEFLKPYLATRRTGVPMAKTNAAVVSERLTDGIAMLILAAISVGTYAADQSYILWILAGAIGAGFIVLLSRGASIRIIRLLGRLPVVGRIAPKLEEMYLALRTCLAPGPLLFTMVLSMVAWGAECVGFLLIFQGLEVEASLDASTFLYAFATIAGGAMPGGLGVADGALVGGTVKIFQTSEAVAVAGALLIRVATLWFGVVLGAIALLRIDALLKKSPTSTSTPTATD
ncbi:MAG: flippase-like domain-containing protein [Proteobacteria bacterium]|nr:flippase-like domain-containing protein [Pseudomonadota bacterium]MCP4921399.1 flippase-like domain-containing protein [Pseudomonadota bacterium]